MLRLLIVDDEQIIREALSEMVDYSSIGYELIAIAKNGMEAYDIICDEYPDVVITDIRMPFLNGLELIERSIKLDSQITFILLSGYSEFEYAKQAMSYGVRHYLLKPTDPNELISTLKTIAEERLADRERKAAEQTRLLSTLQAPLEQCFLMEALAFQDEFPSIYRKYRSLLLHFSDCVHACVCSFVEENYIKEFAADARRILAAGKAPVQFSAIYVKNSMILIFPAPLLGFQGKIQQQLEKLQYPGQTASFQVRFLHASATEQLFQEIIDKISRFQQILLLDEENHVYEIRNNPAAPWRVNQLSSVISQAGEEQQARLLDSVFADTTSPETARDLALSLFLKLAPEGASPTEHTYDFLRKLYGCTNVQEIRNLMRVALPQGGEENLDEQSNAHIAMLKTYVEQHLDSENLSLKWLAENYLFISTSYLSKLFSRKEGMRFSDYLNKKRIEEAERLMVYYHNDNIKSIAQQVGFASNPQYFSQVFKRYTGSTPTEYIKKLKNS